MRNLNKIFKTPNKDNVTGFITTYLDKFEEGTFFFVMRTLFEEMGFLHLDFKLRNIFIREKSGVFSLVYDVDILHNAFNLLKFSMCIDVGELLGINGIFSLNNDAILTLLIGIFTRSVLLIQRNLLF